MGMKQTIIGHFQFGYENVQLVLRDGTGGEFYTNPEPDKCPRIKIGADYSRWDDVVNVLLHECFELAIDRRHGRYRATNDQSYDLSNFVFMFNHHEFSDICAKVAEFVTPALPKLSKEWDKWRKAKAKANKRRRKKRA